MPDPAKVEFLYDVGSPNAFLVHRVIPEVEKRTGAAFTYVPCLIGGIFKATGNKPPMVNFAEVRGKLAYQRLEFARFIKRHGIGDFTMNPHFPVNTLAAMRAAVAAVEDGTHQAFVNAAMDAMWVHGRKLDDPDELAKTLTEAGLDAERLAARIGEDAVKAKLAENTSAAVERGVFGLPTIFVGGEMFFGKERMGQVEEAIAEA